MKKVLKNTEGMSIFATDFLANLKSKEGGATVLGLYGDLGAGKTTFTQSLASALGVNENVVSPTFVIMKIYELRGASNDERKETSSSNLATLNSKFSHLIHIDAYRIEKSTEMLHLGFQNIIENPENLVVIEWPERLADIMPEHVKVMFNHVSENEREVEVNQM